MQEWILRRGSDRAERIAHISGRLSQLDQALDWRLLLTQHKRSRSDPQNNWLWGCAYKLLEEETGMREHDLHEAFCRRYFGELDVEIMGVRIIRPRRTTTTNEEGKRDIMSTTDFSGFMEMVMDAGATVGVDIPPPDPEYFRESKSTDPGAA